MGNILVRIVVAAFAALMLAGCGGVRKDIAYFPSPGQSARLAKQVKVAVLPAIDDRENAKVYPKQIISHTSYSGENTFDINDTPIEDVFREALSVELYNLGVGVVKADVGMGLDKATSDRVRELIREKYPDARVVVGMKVTDFMGSSISGLVTTDVRFSAAVSIYAMDMATGNLVWGDYKSERTDTVLSAGRNYMVDELDGVLSDIMKKAVRDNMSLRDTLVKASY
jgi:uncharacterized lipoprotein YajG